MDVDQSLQVAMMKRPSSVEFAQDEHHADNNATVKRRRIYNESANNNQSQHQFRGTQEPSIQLFQPRIQCPVPGASQPSYFQNTSSQQPMLPDIVCSVNPQYVGGPMHPAPGSNFSGSHYGHGSNSFNIRNPSAAPMELVSDHQYCLPPSRQVLKNGFQSEGNQETGRSFL